MKQRLDREVPRSQAAELWSATYILMGVHYTDALIETLLEGVLAMEESVTYQKIIRKGKAEGETEEARKLLLLLGRNRFGAPSPEALIAVESLTDVQKLEDLTVRLLQASSWDEPLGLNGPSRRGRGRRKTS